jgi:hypothetical protein
MIFRECGVLYLDPPKQHLEEDPSRNFLIRIVHVFVHPHFHSR